MDINTRKRFLFEIDTWLITAVIAYWVFLISDNSIKMFLAIIFGLTSAFVYHFTIKKEEKTTELTRIFALPQEKILIAAFIVFLLAFLTSPINDIYIENWLSIPTANWIRFIIITVFSMLIPGFIIVKLVNRSNKLPTQANIVLSVLLSILFTSTFWYIVKMTLISNDLANILFIASQFILILLYTQQTKKKTKPNKADSPRTLNLNEALTLGTIVLLSVSLVLLQQFIYNPFIRGDNWSYLSISNYIDKNAFTLKPTGKFYRLGPLLLYELFNLGLFRLSGFPPVNSMMITTIVVASLIPLAFYIMSVQYTKNNKLSMLTTFIYIAMSGFGWMPFIAQKIGISVKYYSPQDILTVFKGIAPKVLNDITQPQGSVPEGFKTYVLAILAIIMLLYLLESKLPSKARGFLIASMTAFAFQVHLEEVLIWTFIFMPAYVLLSNRKLNEVRKDIAALAIGFLSTFLIGLTYPANCIVSLTLNYILVAIALSSVFGYTFLKGSVHIETLSYKLRFLKLTFLCLVEYFYLLSIILLVFHGYENMYYGSIIVSQGFTFPWYYYPLSFGIVGILILIGLSMNFQKERSVIFFLVTIMLLLVFGRLVSFVNVNFFFTGTKEWRIIYRIIPIPASLFAGWALYKLMCSLKNATLQLRVEHNRRNFQLHLRSVSTFLFILLIMIGIPSTIMASEYWMVTDATPVGGIFITHEDIEAANFIYQQIPMTSRLATLSSRSNAVVTLAGGTTAVPSTYPDLLSATRPETAALLSSDVGYIYLDKEMDLKSVKSGLINYLPLVFNNSQIAIYELPYLEPPTNSNIGYIAPSLYTTRTLLSYMLLASANFSYQVTCDDIYDKSVLFLPSDIHRTERYVLNLDGVGSYVDLGNIRDIGSMDLTVEAWFKTSASGKFMSLVNKRRSGFEEAGYRLVIRGDTDQIVAELNNGAGTVGAGGQVHNDGKWHHVVAVYDRDDKLRLYVDGSLQAQADISNKMGSIDTDCPLTLGSQEGRDVFFNGSLSSVRIYNRTLSVNDIRWNYANPDNPVNNNLTLRLPLDEGAGNIAYDLSNYKNHGLVHSANWSFEQISIGSVYPVEVPRILDWVKDGGALVVLGDKSVVYELFELQLGDYAEANEIYVGDEVYSLDEMSPFRTLITEDESARILSYYSLNGLDISPFAIQKSLGKGNIIYIYIDPMSSMLSAQQHTRLVVNHIALIIKESLKNADLHLSSSSASSARVPLEKRWMGRYAAYGENDFVAEGNVTVSSTLSGSYLLQHPLTADVVLINSIQTKKALQNVIINKVNIIGKAELEIHSSICEIAQNHQTFSIPSYITLQFKNCTLKIKPVNSSKLEIQTAGESFSIDNGEIIVKLDTAFLLVKKPRVNVSGYIRFAKISLPFTEGAWTRNVKLVGNVTLYIDYNDEKYFFSDEIKGAYSTETPSIYPKIEDNIPWKEIATSPFHILILTCLTSILLLCAHIRIRIVWRGAD